MSHDPMTKDLLQTAANDTATGDIDAISRRAKVLGYLVLAGFFATIGAWSAGASLTGAVVAPGQFVVETNVKKVQHQQGGIVAELRVREGSVVNEGDLVIRLDDTMARANAQILIRQIDEMQARAARLAAERDQASEVVMPAALLERAAGDPEVAALVAGERRLFAIRAAALEGQRAMLAKRIEQQRFEIEGLKIQHAARTREAELIKRELTGVRDLFTRNLVQINRLSALERDAVMIDGQRGQITSQIAQVEGRIAETELQILQLVEDRRSEAMRDLRDIQGKVAELQERRVAAEDQVRRVDIRAPASGVVHQLQVHTVGGVISPGEAAMLVVPSSDLLHLDVQVAATDYDLVTLGQRAQVRLRAFNQRTTPELVGAVSRLAPDATREQQTGQTFFMVRVTIPKSELDRIAPLQVHAGMQAEVYLATGDRTPIGYLMKPVVDQFAKAFRER